jgi:hypothetical protein
MEEIMSWKNEHEETKIKGGTFNRRSILLGGTTLAATSALSAGASIRVASLCAC